MSNDMCDAEKAFHARVAAQFPESRTGSTASKAPDVHEDAPSWELLEAYAASIVRGGAALQRHFASFTMLEQAKRARRLATMPNLLAAIKAQRCAYCGYLFGDSLRERTCTTCAPMNAAIANAERRMPEANAAVDPVEGV